MRYASATAAALGVIGMTGGIVVGLKARDLQQQSDAVCPDSTCGDPHGLDLNSRARSDLMTSEILLGVGGAAIVDRDRVVVCRRAGAGHDGARERHPERDCQPRRARRGRSFLRMVNHGRSPLDDPP